MVDVEKEWALVEVQRYREKKSPVEKQLKGKQRPPPLLTLMLER